MGTLTIVDEMGRRRRQEVKFSSVRSVVVVRFVVDAYGRSLPTFDEYRRAYT